MEEFTLPVHPMDLLEVKAMNKRTRVAVIGGGLGGLSAAISLAKDPQFEITIIEKNGHLGGKLNVLHRDGFSFDLGPSILTMPHIFEELFSMHGRKMSDYVQLIPVRPHWRNFFEDGTIIDLTAKIDDMIHQDKITSRDVDDLKSFYAYAERIYQFTNEVYFKNQSESTLETLRYYPPLKIIPDSDYFSTMHEAITRYISNPYLVDILDYFIKYVGSSPFDAPAVLTVLPYIQWRFDLWYVKDGMFQLSRGLVSLINELPITIRTKTEVTGVIKAGKRIEALQFANGEVFPVDVVVSNMEVIPFYRRITHESAHRLRRYEQKYGPACSGFALHLGVNRTYDQLRHHNFLYSHDLRLNFDNIFHHHKLSQDPTIYLVAPMKTDPSQGPEGCEIIKILPHISVIDDDHPFTASEYAAFREHILDKLERMGLTNLRQHIVTEELWIPETIEEMYYSNHGSIYGVVSDRKKNLGFKTPKRSEFYANVFFVGGSVNPGGGMPMVVLSGQQVIHQIRRLRR